MKIGSLFSGIGGLELGLEWAGVGETVWQVEIDPWCRRVLAKHWPDVTRYEDVTSIDWSSVERPDLLCGGFPCQDISVAGRGAGLAGERSGLWGSYLRAVRYLRPRFVVVENVAALLARGLGDVLGDLAESGYDAEWDCIPAAAVGAPHRRDRVFLIAYTDSGQWAELELDPGDGRTVPSEGEQRVVRGVDGSEDLVPDAGGSGLRVEPVSVVGGGSQRRAGADGPFGELADTDGAGLGERRGPVAVPAEQSALERGGETRSRNPWAVEPAVGRVAHGVPSRVDRLRGLGNAVVPQVAAVIGDRVLQLEKRLS